MNGEWMIVFDASTLILLAKIDLLQIVLRQHKGVIPESVKEEITYKNTMDAKLIVQQIEEKNLTVIKNPVQEKMNLILKDFPIGKGETAAFLIAREKGGVLATDDGLAIKVCKIFSVRFVTAIHFLIDAHLDNFLALEKLKLLKKYGRYSVQIIGDAEERIRGGK